MVGAFSSGPFLTRVLASARGHRCALSAPVEEKVICQFRKQDHSWANDNDEKVVSSTHRGSRYHVYGSNQ